MDELIFVPSRVHKDDLPDTPCTIADNTSYQYLKLPLLVYDPYTGENRKSANEWFCRTYATRLRTKTAPSFIMSLICEGGQE